MKTALSHPTSFSPRGQNPFPGFRTRTRRFRESHPHGVSLLPAGPKVRTRGSRTHIPGPDGHPRRRGRGRGPGPGRHRALCAARVGKPATRSPAVSGAQGREERPAGLATASPGPGNAQETEIRDKIKRKHHKAARAFWPRPQDPQAGGEPPGRWSAPGRPSRTFSVHRRVGGQGSERAGTAWIPFSNPLSRRSLRAASCALSFTSLCHSYMCACLFGDNSRGDYFLGCKSSVFISNERRRRGSEKRKKKTNKEGVNVQETLLQIQIPLGFHSSESLR